MPRTSTLSNSASHVDFTIGSSLSKSAQSVVPGTGSSIFRRSPNVGTEIRFK